MCIQWDALNYELIAAIIGMITGIVGAVLGLLGLIHNRFLAASEFLSGLHDPVFILSRRHVYQRHDEKKPFSLDDADAATVVNFFHKWGLLAQHKYLPMWVFKSGSGPGVIRLYEILLPFITSMRSKNKENLYAGGFEWLYNRLKRIRENDHVELTQAGDAITIKKAVTAPHRTLEERLAAFYHKPVEEIGRIEGAEIDWGKAEGQEEW